MAANDIRIGDTSIGPGRRPLIIAEMSGNHGGSIENALKIVHAAADNGADAIKLQTYTPATLTIDSHRPEFFIDEPGSPWHGRRLWDLYEEAHTPWEWHAEILSTARARGLLCISSAFDDRSVEFLVGLGIDAIKIASFELIHIPLLVRAAQSDKPLLISTGMASLEEVDHAVDVVTSHGKREFVLMKCTSAYPADEKDANLATMLDMRRRHECVVGLSDHTLRPMVAFGATALGASVIEKHFTLSRAHGGPDAAFSIEPAELSELVRGITQIWQSIGTVTYEVQDSERASIKERPSVYVVEPVREGEAFTTRNLRVIRPAGGVSPKYYESLIGRRAASALAAETPMKLEFAVASNDDPHTFERNQRR
jgi:pseudaminic acid synthase